MAEAKETSNVVGDSPETGRPLVQNVFVQVARYATAGGLPTCGVNFENGQVCRFLRQTATMTYVCVESGLPLTSYGDETASIRPTDTCILRAPTTVAVNDVNKLVRVANNMFVVEVDGRRVIVPAVDANQAADTVERFVGGLTDPPDGTAKMGVKPWRPLGES